MRHFAGLYPFQRVQVVPFRLADPDPFHPSTLRSRGTFSLYTTYFHDPLPSQTTVGIASLTGRANNHIETTVVVHK